MNYQSGLEENFMKPTIGLQNNLYHIWTECLKIEFSEYLLWNKTKDLVVETDLRGKKSFLPIIKAASTSAADNPSWTPGDDGWW